MCGIFGVVAKEDARYSRAFIRKSLEKLMKASQSRGKDSSGLTIRDSASGSYAVLKGPIQLDSLLGAPAVVDCLDGALERYGANGMRAPFVVIGHSRLVTNGSQLHDVNNQPVVKDGIIGIHNGIIVNDASLWTEHPELDRTHSIDTEVLLALIRKYIGEGTSVAAAIARADAEIEGTVSSALLFADLPVLALATNNGSLYTLTNGRDLLFFASEAHPLSLVAEATRLDTTGEFEIRQMVSGSGLTLSLDTFTLNRFDLSEAQHVVGRDQTGSGDLPAALSIKVMPIATDHEQRELVLDVALIASAPRAKENAAKLEFNFERIAVLKRCSRCILPETFPFIQYDATGVCNYCRNYRLKNQPKPFEDLLDLIEPYRRTDGKPDCIVPFSGGRDSTYALHIIKTKLGLNPIAFTYDWGMVTDLGRRNIARACGKLGVENIIVAADIRWKRANIRKNILAWLKRPHLGMIPLFMAGDKYFYYYVDRVKKQTGISLNLWGINPLENTDFKVGFMGVPPDHDKEHIYSLSLKRQLSLFTGIGTAILQNPAYVNTSVWDTLGSFVSRSVLPHRDYFHLFDYTRWDEKEIDRLLLDEYKWETAVDTKTTWRIGDGTAAFYNYIYYTVAGFSEHDTFRSNQVREGALTRDEALRLASEENRPRYATIKWYTDVLGLDYDSTVRRVNLIPKLYP